MSRQITVDHQEWTARVEEALPHLSKPQVTVLALFSLGMVCARSRALSAVTAFLAVAVDQQANTPRQRLRESCWEATAKAGRKRRAIVVESCFVPLLRWVVSRWQGTQLALALDATTLGDRFVVLAISVVHRGGAIPVAGVILAAGEKHAGRREWVRMLRLLRPAIPPTWTVLVLADRGLDARWLFRRIVRLGRHPFVRINKGGTFRPADRARFRPLTAFVPRTGTRWCGCGIAFTTPACRLPCTLLARWEDGHTDPWLILTDLTPQSCDPCWYGLRIWIERGFKLTKRGGWQWQATRMNNPERAARLWLVVAVATLWLVSVGGEADVRARECGRSPRDRLAPANPSTPGHPPARGRRLSPRFDSSGSGDDRARPPAFRSLHSRAVAHWFAARAHCRAPGGRLSRKYLPLKGRASLRASRRGSKMPHPNLSQGRPRGSSCTLDTFPGRRSRDPLSRRPGPGGCTHPSRNPS